MDDDVSLHGLQTPRIAHCVPKINANHPKASEDLNDENYPNSSNDFRYQSLNNLVLFPQLHDYNLKLDGEGGWEYKKIKHDSH